MKKSMILALVVLCLMLAGSIPAFAAEDRLPLTLSAHQKQLTDGNEKKSVSVQGQVTVSSETPMDSLYLIFYEETTDLVLTVGTVEKTVSVPYLRQFVSLSELFGAKTTEVTVTFGEKVGVTELYAFSDAPPAWVQVWEPPCEKADLCLMTTHADDEQLFFAGILPTYAGERGYEVQVVYFTDHKNEQIRRHELLRGLWTVGVRHYPVIGPFPDLFSKSGDAAEKQQNQRGFSHEDIVGFQVEMLRRFKPLVVVGHDPLGEYSHGQHILNSETLQEAVGISANAEMYPESAEKYGVHDVPKTYLHLYKENPIVMNWDVPLEKFGGKTGFQVTQEGFLCHDSQQYTWFRKWLNGKNGEITAASQITTYSPCEYGLFRSLVGEDVEKNDFFENQLSYAQIRQKEEEERLRLEEEARLRAEEEKRKEEERKKAEAEEQARRERERREAEEKRARKTLTVIAAAGGISILLIAVAILAWGRKKRASSIGRNDDDSSALLM